MSTTKYEVDDYGVELVADSQPDKQQEAPKQEEEVKVEPVSEQKPKVESKPKIDKLANAEDADEEAMYELEGRDVAAVEEKDDGFVVEQDKEFQDTIVVFDSNQFVIYNFSEGKSWNVGDLESTQGGFTTIAEDASVARVIQNRHRTSAMQAIVSGGYKQGAASPAVIALAFDTVKINAVENHVCNMLGNLPDLLGPRYMHQSAIVRGKTGSWSLMVVGGKDSKRNWLKSVEMLDLLPYFKQGMMSKKADGTLEKMTTNWTECSDMQSPRSNFALIALQNFVYVYGGISGHGEGESAHHPTLADPVIERYTPQNDIWDTIVIAQAPSLGAFSWTQIGDEPKIAILGGTNGDIMTEEFMIIDFKLETVLSKQTAFEFNTCMGKLAYSESKDTLYHIGGLNSEGVDYSLKMGSTEWEQMDHNHSVLLNAHSLDFCNNTFIYFP